MKTPPIPDKMPASSARARRLCFHAGMAAIAGLLAGAVATLAQLLLWLVADYDPWFMLLRDSRLAAAILLGPDVLPPASGFDWKVMVSATLLHLALSAIYGLLLAPLALLARMWAANVLGALAGLLLYGVNMHGFTLVFPWFVASRDWITVAAHLLFGASAVAIFGCAARWLGGRRSVR